ncbi:hypothetical protein ACP4OV_011157 [Aristida adscensionis]
MVKGKTSLGRQKIVISLIKKEEARQVCFSKRRKGLFKKASELSIMCGAMVGAIFFSPFGRAFSFGHPSVEAVIKRFFTSIDTNASATGGSSHDNGSIVEAVESFNELQAELQELVEIEKKRTQRLEEAIQREMGGTAMELLDANKKQLGLQVLTLLSNELEAIIGEIVKCNPNQVLVEARQLIKPSMDMVLASQNRPMTSPSSDNGFVDGPEVDDPFHSSSDSLVTSPNDQNLG